MPIPSKPDPSTLPLARFPEEWATEVVRLGGRTFHGKQVFRWIHARGVTDASKMTDLPVALRAARSPRSGLAGVLDDRERASRDGRHAQAARRACGDGANVETVLIPRVTAGDRICRTRPVTTAPSTRTPTPPRRSTTRTTRTTRRGRAAGGEARTVRSRHPVHLHAGRLRDGLRLLRERRRRPQASHAAPTRSSRRCSSAASRLDEGERIRNVVLMGMGEPLHNYEATARALRLLTHPDGHRALVAQGDGLDERARPGDRAARPGLQRADRPRDLAPRRRRRDALARSCRSTRSTRSPVLMEALRAYPLPQRRRITIEYTLVAGKNDTPDEARKLAKLLRGLPVKMNLIPMNPIEASHARSARSRAASSRSSGSSATRATRASSAGAAATT